MLKIFYQILYYAKLVDVKYKYAANEIKRTNMDNQKKTKGKDYMEHDCSNCVYNILLFCTSLFIMLFPPQFSQCYNTLYNKKLEIIVIICFEYNSENNWIKKCKPTLFEH